ncbi:MAG TPA: aspartate dehydrogenase [Steroidobacteraceae bacterium]|nr:aspartate dehydrogenase [Steroidobacteraceae bacterium]
MSRIAVLGYGAITDEMVSCLEQRNDIHRLAGALGRASKLEPLRAKASGRFPVVASVEELLELRPDLVIEAAGHAALEAYAPTLLANGVDVLAASAGALAKDSLAQQLMRSAAGGAQVWLASGATAGIDGILAARSAGLRSVIYTSLKPPLAWKGTPGESLLAQSPQSGRVIFFRGTAREAATRYPQNANVSATIAIAGLGLDATQVQLGADPSLGGPLGIIETQGDFGAHRFEIRTTPSRTNPKTSAITGHSLISAALDGMRFGAFNRLAAALRSR